MLDDHPALAYLLLLGSYMTGQVLLVICTAFIASKSRLNGLQSWIDYFKLRWPPLALRWFISLCLFMLVWQNPKVINLDAWVPTFAMQMGLCGIFGWVSDSVLDKVLVLIFPGIAVRELPPVPEPPDATPT